MEGVFAQQRPTHPFRIIEHDAISIQSMTSLGRVGRILAGSIDVSNISVEKEASLLTTTNSTNNQATPQTTTTVTTATAPIPTSTATTTSVSHTNLSSHAALKNIESPVPSRSDKQIVLQGYLDQF